MTESDILLECAGEEKNILLDGGDLGPQTFQTPLSDVDPIDQNTACTRIEDAIDQPC